MGKVGLIESDEIFPLYDDLKVKTAKFMRKKQKQEVKDAIKYFEENWWFLV